MVREPNAAIQLEIEKKKILADRRRRGEITWRATLV
jgi:hypothetical protein